MKIEYQDGGIESRLIITSWFFDWRVHNRLVDEILFRTPQLRAEDEGFFRKTTIISGKTAYVLCAEVVAEENGFEVREANS
ncbi:hypothetical protein MLB55_003531 [Salmonella enterica]|uniref:Uncharacterized protein n=1 Tax=Salmonella newport TaxID=108619 RepID=A0A5X8Y4R6_SALNE|nr:hypothetical protein [Salmonella enterica]EBS4088921.1 hypothetical protein [Salmonella enterica subsp. enterica serovar Newport]EDV5626819.1 hypothetical protein [Salmonella enterica subsp. enterica]EBS4409025.1 hypothetical protein [Salmonella enterica subsp. enterica serovar Newport]EBV0465631.1 hypothetical protein [Salmonella enterica subsp. enterica serovar Newport]